LDLAAGPGIGFRSKSGFGVRYLPGLSKTGYFDPAATIDPGFQHGTLQA